MVRFRSSDAAARGCRTLGNCADTPAPRSRRARAPGVYVEGDKIAALGLRIRGGSSYQGLALNVNPDLTAFGGINPCGYAGLAVTSLATLGLSLTLAAVNPVLVAALQDRFYGGAAHRIMNPTLMPPAG